MESKYNFVYITSNLISGKQYVGDHSTNNLDCWKTKNYLGSGKYLFRAIKKYGKQNFKKEILEFFPSKKEAFKGQEKYIQKYNTLTPNGYNISPAGGKESSSSYFSEETKQKIGAANKISLKGRKMPEEVKDKISNTLLGKKVSEETKQKIGAANKISLKGRKMPEEVKDKISNTLMGVSKSEESRKNMSLSRKGKKFRKGTKIGKTNKGKSWEEIYGVLGAQKRRENFKKKKYESL